MIISCSRRSDVPAVYPLWLKKRLQAGYALYRHPFKPKDCYRVSLAPEDVSALYLWTKNPTPLLPHIQMLAPYLVVFQITLTPYAHDLEANINKQLVLSSFFKLRELYPATHLVWRYDPIIFSDTYTVDFHLQSFQALAKQLKGVTERCMLSFLDDYPQNRKKLSSLGIERPSLTKKIAFLQKLQPLAQTQGIIPYLCAEEGIPSAVMAQGACLDRVHLETLSGFKVTAKKDAGQRKACACLPSVDIGAYNTCPLGCAYCYAQKSSKALKEHLANHQPNDPFLSGVQTPKDQIKPRLLPSIFSENNTFF